MKYDFELKDSDFRILREFIHERYGFYFKDDKQSYIQMKLYPRASALGMTSFCEYIQYVKFGPRARAEQSRMMSLLTNTETYFFRETPQLDCFRDTILPELRERKLACGSRKIRILSAGCSTGEEVYTLAMLAFESGSFFWDWDFKIIGVDINERALDVARRGVYFQRSFRMTDQMYMNKFFANNCDGFEAKASIKRMTEFTRGNIADAATWQGFGELDVIFCRNVLIYFSDEKIKEALKHFHAVLGEKGYLLLGHSETLSSIDAEFEAVRFPNTIIYKKKPKPNLADIMGEW